MNFALDETQEAMAGLARQVLADHGGHERARRAEAADGFDGTAWRALGATGLLAAVAAGEGGVVGAAQIALEVGRHVVTVPGYALLTALTTVGALGLGFDDQRDEALLQGADVATVALHEAGVPDATRSATADTAGSLTGEKPAVPALVQSSVVLVAAAGAEGPGLYAVGTGDPGVEGRVVHTTDRGAAAHLLLDGAAARRVGGLADVVRAEQVATVLACATLVGLGRAATAGAASYISARHQFGRPIASFQAPALRLADAHIDLEAMHVTLLQAAWQLDHGDDAGPAVSVAKWWSAEGGHRILHTAQHLHGGVGADVEYPAHRYFLRGKQLIDTLGGAPVHAERIGAAIAAGTVSQP